MNNPLLFILGKRMKNKIVSIFKKPSQLFFTVFIILMFVISFIGGNASRVTNVRDINELFAIIIALFAFVFILTSFNGISKGASLFSMADVNFLFASPTKSLSILVYGLVQQMGTSLLLGFFLLFQYSLIHSTYGVNMGFLFITLIFYALMGFCGQLTAMVIYTLTSSDDKKRNIVKYIFMGICVVAVAAIFLKTLSLGQDNMLENLIKVSVSLPVSLFPVIGWARMIIMGIYAGTFNLLYVLLGSALIVAYIIAMVLLVKFCQADYYEDVLKATEISHSAITARKEGKVADAVPQNVKVGKIGLDGGFGSGVFYYKHRVESRRTKVFFFDTVTLIYIAITIGFSFFMKNSGIIPVLVFATYMQMFSVALGRWTKEFLLPYIYLIPEKPFKKLFNCLKESFLKISIEAVVVFVAVGIVMKLDVFTIISCIILRITFGALFTAGNLFVDRFFGAINIKAITMILYFLFLILFSAPAIIAIIIMTTVFVQMSSIAFLAASVCNAAMALLVLFVSRNVLEYAELNNQ